jgi:F-type H+-transporting ATPase subunit epsilon
MADGKLSLEIVTPRGPAVHEDVDSVAAPSSGGEFGVLPGHVPLLASLRTGIVKYQKGGEEHRIAVAAGFVEVSADRVLLLTDKVIRREEIDPVRVRLELKDVDEALAKYAGPQGGPEWQELVSRELWAAAQLELYGDPPAATQRLDEEFGPPAPPDESEVSMPVLQEDKDAPTAAKEHLPPS